jgi:hypothetical protein
MAIQYLNNIDLNKNELQNGVIHVLGTAPSNPVAGQIYYNSTDTKLYFYDGTNWIDASGDIKSVTTTTPTSLDITDPNGPNPSLAIVTAAVTNGGTALATGDQIFDHVATSIGNISFTIQGTANEVEVTGGSMGDGSTATIGLPNNVTITNDLTVNNDTTITNDLTVNGNVLLGNATSDTVIVAGDLTVNGTTTTVNSNTVNIGDSIITLNSDETGSPSQDAGIEIERGTSDNRSLVWDESEGEWTIQQDSGTYERIATYADSVEDVIIEETGTSGITVTETLSGTDNRIKTYDIAVNFSDFSYKESIGDGTNTSYAVDHNLGSKDVIVQLYDVSSFETVYADVTRTTTNRVTIDFASAPSTNDIRVLIQKL